MEKRKVLSAKMPLHKREVLGFPKRGSGGWVEKKG
jgi:hypothetical protein